MPRRVLFGFFALFFAVITAKTQANVLDDFLDLTGLDRLLRSNDSEFNQFVRDFWPQARAQGITPQTYREAFSGVTPDLSVFERAQNQAEFKTSLATYLDKRVTSERIALGVKMAKRYQSDLKRMETVFGVSRFVVLAIWGLESHYGRTLGDKDIIRALATLAYRGSRQKFGRTQLLSALKILQDRDVSRTAFKGSWAGAMGHTQFIPSTYLAYGVDWTGDGRRDIWTTPLDALASTAHYLSRSGWVSQEPWGGAVLGGPSIFSKAQGKRMRLSEWNRLGVTFLASSSSSTHDFNAQLLIPEDNEGLAYLIGKNFDAILAYNRSNAYALSVGLLADAIRTRLSAAP